MFAALTTEENNHLFMALHRGYRKADRHLSYLIETDAPNRMYRPALGLVRDIVTLLADLQAAPEPATVITWRQCDGTPGCRCDEHMAPEPTGSRGPR